MRSDLLNIKGQLDGDQFFITNELHYARGFRKLHLECARIGQGLQILHCVMFPDPVYDIPIFGVDVVLTSSGISAAIVDLSPVSTSLPSSICTQLTNVSNLPFRSVRDLPEWGNIFSDYVIFIRPEDEFEERHFLDLVDKYLNILIQYSLSIKPKRSDEISTIKRTQYQRFYCLQQRRNDKTRNVLTKAFGQEWADRYINTLLFDSP